MTKTKEFVVPWRRYETVWDFFTRANRLITAWKRKTGILYHFEDFNFKCVVRAPIMKMGDNGSLVCTGYKWKFSYEVED